MLVLSNPSATDITILVTDDDSTASESENFTNPMMNVYILKEEALIMILDHTMLRFLLERHLLHLMFQ